MKEKLTKQRQLTIGIIGFGNFGQFLAKRFVARGHKVIGTSRGDYVEVAKQIGAEFFTGWLGSGAHLSLLLP